MSSVEQTTSNHNLLTISGLDIFGKRYLKPHCKAHGVVFNGIKISSEFEKLRDICTKILSGTVTGINYLMVDRLVHSFTDQDYNALTNILLEAFDKTSKEFANNIESSLNNASFTLKLFLEKYQEYYNNTNVLRRSLCYYDHNMVSDNKSAKYSYIVQMKNVAIFANVVNKQYKYQGENLYLYEIFNKFLTDQTSLSEVLALFKIYQFYNMLTSLNSISKENHEKYNLNSDLKNKFKLVEKSPVSDKIISTLMNYCTELVKDVSKEKDNDKATQMLNNIRNILQMGMAIGNKAYFLLMYQSFLTDRLLKYQSDPKIELELTKMFFSYKEDPELYAKMTFQIYDAISSKVHIECFKGIKVELKSEKFKNYDVKKLRRDDCNFLVTRNYAWSFKDNDQYNVPDEIGIYMTIFTAYFNDRFKGDKKLTFLHNTSTGILKLKLGKDVIEEYHIQMTLAQIYVVLTIAKAGTISAKDISTSLNVHLSKLAPIFNSLIDADLICRGTGQRNDPNILFSMHWNKSFPSKKLSLVPLVRKLQGSSSSSSTVRSTQQEQQDNKINVTVLRVKLLSVILNKKQVSFNELKLDLERSLSMTIDDSLLHDELKHAMSTNTITKDNEFYVYCAKSNSLIDDDSEEEESSSTILRSAQLPPVALKEESVSTNDKVNESVKEESSSTTHRSAQLPSVALKEESVSANDKVNEESSSTTHRSAQLPPVALKEESCLSTNDNVNESVKEVAAANDKVKLVTIIKLSEHTRLLDAKEEIKLLSDLIKEVPKEVSVDEVVKEVPVKEVPKEVSVNDKVKEVPTEVSVEAVKEVPKEVLTINPDKLESVKEMVKEIPKEFPDLVDEEDEELDELTFKEQATLSGFSEYLQPYPVSQLTQVQNKQEVLPELVRLRKPKFEDLDVE